MNETNNQTNQQPNVNPQPVNPIPQQVNPVGQTNNVQPTNNEQKPKKSNSLLIVCITIIIVAVASTVMVLTLNKDKEDKKDNNTQTTENNNTTTNTETKPEEKKLTKIDETKGIYYIKDGNSYKSYAINDEEFATNISYSYPIINSKNDNVTKINDEIKKIYNDSENGFISNNTGEGCSCVVINGKEKCVRIINYNKYKVTETDSILNVQIIGYGVNYCGAGYDNLIKSYFISKTTGEVLSNEEIVKAFNYDSSSLVNAYNTYLEHLKTKDKDYFKDLKNITTIDELTLTITENKKLSIYGPGYGNAMGFDLEYDGTKVTNPAEAD